MRKPLSRNKLGLAIAFASMNSVAQISFAQDANLFVEEILVTARKQTESLQDIPLSLSAFDANEIEQQAIESTEDIAKLTSGLTFTKGIGGQDLRPDIRGVTQLSGRSNVAILVDGVDITTDAITGTGAGQFTSLGLYDLERVEVVRGPQSALFGRNAFAGAINYITKKPSSEFEGTLNLEIAEYGTQKYKVGVTGPISDTVLYRVNVAHSEKDGQYDDPTNNAPLAEEDTDSVSVTLQFLPTDELEVITRLDYTDSEKGPRAIAVSYASTCIYDNPNTGGKQTVEAGGTYLNNDGIPTLCTPDAFGEPGTANQPTGTISEADEDNIQMSDDEFLGNQIEQTQFVALVNYEIGDDYTFTSNSSYTDAETIDDFDLDHQENFDTAAAPGGASNAVFFWVDEDNEFNYHADRDNEREAIFQDFRLSFDNADDLRWLVGMEYFDEEYTQNEYSRANDAIERDDTGFATGQFATIQALCSSGYCSSFVPPEIPVTDVFFEDLTVPLALGAETVRETTAMGFYGSIDWLVTEEWEISFSARYQEEKVELVSENLTPTGSVPVTPRTVVPNLIVANAGSATSTFIPTPFPLFGNCTPAVGFGFNCPDPETAFAQVPGDPAFQPPATFELEDKFYAFNPRLVVTHFYNDDVMFFASIAKGTKPGGINSESDLVSDLLGFDQEELLSYEFGWKTSWMDDRIIWNGAVYFMENEDKHANTRTVAGQTFTGLPRSYIDNVGETEVTGFESQVAAVISENLRMNFNYSYIETEITDYTNPGAPGFSSRNPLDTDDNDQSGNELPYTPNHNFNLGLTYDFTISDQLDGYIQIDTRYSSEKYVSTNNILEADARTVTDLKAGIIGENFEVIAFLDNVENDNTPDSAVTFPDFQGNFSNIVLANMPDKRTAGLRVKYSF